jgi:thioester reductase-like protein
MTVVPIRQPDPSLPPLPQVAPRRTGHDTPPRYLVTGGTGFIGRRLIPRLLGSHPEAEVWALVRPRSLVGFERTASAAGWGPRLLPLVGDVTTPRLGLSEELVAEIGDVDHVVHCAAIYDITADDAMQRAANVEGTRAVICMAKKIDATLHHVSSIAVAGTFPGTFAETDFDVSQELPTPYHQTKFEAEELVRNEPGLRYRIYRPGVVVGDSRTGEMDKIDGPYYFFALFAELARLPRYTPMRLPDTGRNNIVPVDYVVDAMAELMHQQGRDGQTFHLTASAAIGLCGIYRGIASAAGLPPLRGKLPSWTSRPVLNATGRAKTLRNRVAHKLGIPAEVFDIVDLAPTFSSEATQAALRGTGITVPDFASYAPKLWTYWAQHLDPRLTAEHAAAMR